MKNIYVFLMTVFLVALEARAHDLPEPPFSTNIVQRMVENHTLHLKVSGCVTGEFNRALGILQSSNVLDRIQRAYAVLLPEGEKPEFTVNSITNGHYFYVNKHEERSDIYEIKRDVGVLTNEFTGIMYVQGERSFGMFESLITMRVWPSDDKSADLLNYSADIQVYPHCMALRFVLKYLPGVKRYFRNKTLEMKVIITGVFNYMIKAPEVIAFVDC